MFAGETSSVHNIHSVDSTHPYLLSLGSPPFDNNIDELKRSRKFHREDNFGQFHGDTKMTSRQPITADNLQRHL